MLSKRIYTGANWSHFLSQSTYSSQTLSILVNSDPSGGFLDFQNPARAPSVTPRDVCNEQIQSEVRRRHLKPPIGALAETNFKYSVELNL